MGKVAIGPQWLVCPMPVVLVGANVEGKPNFMTVGGYSTVNVEPPMISVAVEYTHYTYRGIKQNLTFSVNIPSVDMVKETDYCGLRHGSEVNKVEVCQFKVFYGKTEGAPLIEQCPVGMECKVVHTLDLGGNWLIIGKIQETHITESCLTNRKPDVSKIKPFTIARTRVHQYQALGEVIGRAYNIGKELRARE